MLCTLPSLSNKKLCCNTQITGGQVCDTHRSVDWVEGASRSLRAATSIAMVGRGQCAGGPELCRVVTFPVSLWLLGIGCIVAVDVVALVHPLYRADRTVCGDASGCGPLANVPELDCAHSQTEWWPLKHGTANRCRSHWRPFSSSSTPLATAHTVPLALLPLRAAASRRGRRPGASGRRGRRRGDRRPDVDAVY